MRIVIDLDGVICEIKKEGQDYLDVTPMPGAKEWLESLKKQGYYIIISTARHMLSTESNVGLVKKKIGKKTFDWLDKHGIPYDEIYFGKPYGHVYIDDNALEFNGWDEFSPDFFNTSRVNIVIPMAGLGSRFTQAGFDVPKPLIDVAGKYMFERAVDSFSHIMDEFSCRLIFVILKEHDVSYSLSSVLREKYPSCEVVMLDGVTKGQAQSVLAAKQFINSFNKLLIYNADTYCLDENLPSLMHNERVDGAVSCFESLSSDARYSFAKIDAHSNVVSVAEKIKISDWASTGLYYFKKGRDFVKVAERMIAQNELNGGEFYVMPLYNRLLTLGKRIKMSKVTSFDVFGTPEELEKYLSK